MNLLLFIAIFSGSGGIIVPPPVVGITVLREFYVPDTTPTVRSLA